MAGKRWEERGSGFFHDCTEELLLFFWPSLSLECRCGILETMLSLRVLLSESLMSLSPSLKLLLKFHSQVLEDLRLLLPWYHHLPHYVCVCGGAFGLHLSQDYPAEVRVSLQEPLCALCLANLGHKPILSSQQHYCVFVRHRSIVCPLCPKTTVPQDIEFRYGSRKSLIYLT